MSKTSIEKLSSGKAIGKSVQNGFTVYQHMETINRINVLYKNASFLHSENDFYGRKNVIFKKYESSFKFKNGKQGKAYITVMNVNKTENIIYSLELLK